MNTDQWADLCLPEYVTLLGHGYEISYLFSIQFENVYSGLAMIRDSNYLNDAFNKLYIRSIGVKRISFEIGSNVNYKSAFISVGS